jgi:hypothetical protein
MGQLETEKGSVVVDRAVAGTRARTGRRPRRKDPDGRLWVVRRTKMLARLYADRVGEAASDPIIAASIKRAAELQALADELRQRALRGDESVSPDDVVRVTRLADQSVRRLFEKAKAQVPQPTSPGLSDYLRAHHSEETA